MLKPEPECRLPIAWIRAIILLPLLSLVPATLLPAQDARDPFNLPEQRAEIHAIRQVTLEGILRTADYKVCLARVADAQRLAVLAESATISLEHGGRPHRFTVFEIREKSVVFKDERQEIYEVPIQ